MALALDVRPSDSLRVKILALQGAQAGFSSGLSKVVRESAIAVVARAKDMVPVSTGALRRSLQAYFIGGGLTALIGSYLPYAARQEFDATLDHSQRPAKKRKVNTIAGNKGSIIKGTGQFNPNAQYGFLRKALAEEKPYFLNALRELVGRFGSAWEGR